MEQLGDSRRPRPVNHDAVQRTGSSLHHDRHQLGAIQEPLAEWPEGHVNGAKLEIIIANNLANHLQQ